MRACVSAGMSVCVRVRARASRISGSFYLVGGSVRDIDSAVQSNKVDHFVKCKQLVDGAETEIKKER